MSNPHPCPPSPNWVMSGTELEPNPSSADCELFAGMPANFSLCKKTKKYQETKTLTKRDQTSQTPSRSNCKKTHAQHTNFFYLQHEVKQEKHTLFAARCLK